MERISQGEKIGRLKGEGRDRRFQHLQNRKGDFLVVNDFSILGKSTKEKKEKKKVPKKTTIELFYFFFYPIKSLNVLIFTDECQVALDGESHSQ